MAILNGTSASEGLKGTQVADTINGKAGDDRLPASIARLCPLWVEIRVLRMERPFLYRASLLR